jgi:hypothetical protein
MEKNGAEKALAKIHNNSQRARAYALFSLFGARASANPITHQFRLAVKNHSDNIADNYGVLLPFFQVD